jgi:membrane-bound ClpP family serine protease
VLVHGELWTAQVDGGPVAPGERVRVLAVEGLRLRVERAPADQA